MPPSESGYWGNERRAWVCLARAGGRLAGFDPAPPRDVTETIGAMYEDGDPLDDALLDVVTSPEEAGAMVHEAAAKGIKRTHALCDDCDPCSTTLA